MQFDRSVMRALFLTLLVAGSSFAGPLRIRDVSIAPSFFNPTVGQSASITFQAAVQGTARISILDRDRFAIRTLAPVAVKPGPVSVAWDGRDDRGAVVPDEAWNVRIELGGEVYDPSLDFVPVTEDPQPRVYSRVEGVLSYTLARPSRVHIEAGQAKRVGEQYSREGPILKTVLDREPRVAGRVVERWNGFDQGGTIDIPSLPDFVISVLATSLPDSSIITRGNYRQSFLDYASQRRPASALEVRRCAVQTHHHAGLNVFEDQSPALDVRRTRTADGGLRLEVRVAGAAAPHFLAQPGDVAVYVDERKVLARENPTSPLIFTIPETDLAGGSRVVVNWGSDYGPVGMTAFQLKEPRTVAAQAGVKR